MLSFVMIISKFYLVKRYQIKTFLRRHVKIRFTYAKKKKIVMKKNPHVHWIKDKYDEDTILKHSRSSISMIWIPNALFGKHIQHNIAGGLLLDVEPSFQIWF